MVICLVASACGSGIITADSIVPTDTKQSKFSATNSIQVNTSTPTIPIETATPTEEPSIEIVVERNPVDSSMVKGVEPAVPLKLDENGNIIGLPPNASQAWANKLKAFYNAVIKKYPTSEIYLDVDVSSNCYVIIILMGGTVFYQTFKNQDGNYVYSNFPSSFENVDNQLELSGDYKPIKIPNTSLGVIWTDGIPQLLANYVELPNGETYFTHYMDYSGVWDFNAYPWKEVTGFQEIMASFPPIEMDIEPIYTQTTEYEYMGVKISAELVVDESALPGLSKVTIPHPTYAEYISRLLFYVWWVRGNIKHTVTPTDVDFRDFMMMWSKAQESGDTFDWEKVQINDIWANDLGDGLGYIQKAIKIWPMYSGIATEGVLPIEKLTITFVGYSKSEYVTLYSAGFTGDGSGTNYSDQVLYLYLFNQDFLSYNVYLKSLVARIMTGASWWLKSNKGEGTMYPPTDAGEKSQYNLLIYGGLTVN